MHLVLSMQPDKKSLVPAQFLRAVHKMLIAGLCSTQIRIKVNTYRYLTMTPILGSLRRLPRGLAKELLAAMEICAETIEIPPIAPNRVQAVQVQDYATRGVDRYIDYGGLNPETLYPTVEDDFVQWNWTHPELGTTHPLGTEDVFTPSQLDAVHKYLAEEAAKEAVREWHRQQRRLQAIAETREQFQIPNIVVTAPDRDTPTPPIVPDPDEGRLAPPEMSLSGRMSRRQTATKNATRRSAPKASETEVLVEGTATPEAPGSPPPAIATEDVDTTQKPSKGKRSRRDSDDTDGESDSKRPRRTTVDGEDDSDTGSRPFTVTRGARLPNGQKLKANFFLVTEEKPRRRKVDISMDDLF
jgi:hypothetical protein